MQAMKTYRE